MNAQQEYDRLVNELKEVRGGSRGWSSLTDSRLAKCGLNRGSVNAVVASLGLSTVRQGSHGWTASK